MERKEISEVLKILSCIEYGLIFLILFSVIFRAFSGPIVLLLLYGFGVLSGYLGISFPVYDLIMSLRNFFLRGNTQ